MLCDKNIAAYNYSQAQWQSASVRGYEPVIPEFEPAAAVKKILFNFSTDFMPISFMLIYHVFREKSMAV